MKETAMSISALGTGSSGMQSYQRATDISANNVANSQTSGYVPQQAAFKENAGGGVSVSGTATVNAVVKNADASSADNDSDANDDVVGQLTYQVNFELSAKDAQTADQLLGSLIDTEA